MVQTSDNFKANTGGDQNGDGFAQPKGVQTRKAIAQHLAQKLKIDGDLDPGQAYEQYQAIQAEKEQQSGSKTHWDLEI